MDVLGYPYVFKIFLCFLLLLVAFCFILKQKLGKNYEANGNILSSSYVILWKDINTKRHYFM